MPRRPPAVARGGTQTYFEWKLPASNLRLKTECGAIRKAYASRRKIIEGKANGDAVIDSLKHEIPGIVVFEPGRDSKEGRATAVSPYIRAGNVHLPTTRVASMAPEISFDVEAFILEATSFPNAAHDDQIDAASMYLIETYRVSGESSILVPIGRIPLSSVKRQGQQALAPFQRRFVERQLRR
jgi:predicted phage terminase large subunit-like protein